MKTAAMKPYLTLREFAKFVGRTYGTVWLWASEGRIQTEQRPGKKKSYRVPADVAEATKKRLEDGLWI